MLFNELIRIHSWKLVKLYYGDTKSDISAEYMLSTVGENTALG